MQAARDVGRVVGNLPEVGYGFSFSRSEQMGRRMSTITFNGGLVQKNTGEILDKTALPSSDVARVYETEKLVCH